MTTPGIRIRRRESPAGAADKRGGGPGLPAPIAGTVIDANGNLQLGITEAEITASDGSAVAQLSVSFTAPSGQIGTLTAPLIGLAPVVSTTGGTLAGGANYFYAVSAVDSNGGESSLSFIAQATTPAGSIQTRSCWMAFSFRWERASFQRLPRTKPAVAASDRVRTKPPPRLSPIHGLPPLTDASARPAVRSRECLLALGTACRKRRQRFTPQPRSAIPSSILSVNTYQSASCASRAELARGRSRVIANTATTLTLEQALV